MSNSLTAPLAVPPAAAPAAGRGAENSLATDHGMARVHQLLRHSVAFSVALNLLALVPTLYLLQVYDRVLASRSLETLAMLLVVAALAHAVTLVLDAARSQLMLHMGQQLDDLLASASLLAQLVERARSAQTSAGATLQDIALLRSTVSGPGAVAVLDAPWMLVYLLVVFSFHWVLGAAALASMLALVAVAWWNQRDSDRTAAQYTHSQRQLDTLTGQIQRHAQVLYAFGMGPGVVARWQARRADGICGQTALSARNARFKSLSKALRQLIQTLMMALGAWLVIEQHATPGIMIATTILLGKALAPAEQLIGAWKPIAELRVAWPRIKALLAPASAPTLALPQPLGAIQVESLHVAASRPGSAQPSMLLHNVSFALPAGQMLAVLMGSVADNIARTLDGAGRNDAAVVVAAQRAGVHEMVLRLPHGYETEIGESGHLLSGGQCQRIALARALYGEPRLVVLDEPNSNLDADGEAALARTLQLLKQYRVTTIVVTHRPQLVGLADQVLLLRAGHVERYGPRQEVDHWLKTRAQEPAKDGPALRSVA